VSESAGRILSPCCCGCIRVWGGALCVGGGCCGGGISAAGAHGMCPRWLGPAAACRTGGSTGMTRLAATTADRQTPPASGEGSRQLCQRRTSNTPPTATRASTARARSLTCPDPRRPRWPRAARNSARTHAPSH
jgi:hypothetical protein